MNNGGVSQYRGDYRLVGMGGIEDEEVRWVESGGVGGVKLGSWSQEGKGVIEDR